MIKNTFELRKIHGKFTAFENESTDNLRNHVGNCQACGSNKPESLVGVKSQDGKILLVGSTCASILTSGKNPSVDSALINSGEIYQDGTKEVIYITNEWLKSLGDYIFKTGERYDRVFGKIIVSFENNYNGAYHSVNYSEFLYSVYSQAYSNKKITVKQYQAVNKVMGK